MGLTSLTEIPLIDEDNITTRPPTLAPSFLLHKNDGIRSVVGVTCLLSMAGSILIIFSYLVFRDLRTKARLILVHLSIGDFGVALANLFGAVFRFDRYFQPPPPHHHHHQHSRLVTQLEPKSMDNLCQAQAFVAHFSTISSVLWTIILAVYMYTFITKEVSKLSTNANKAFNKFMSFSYLFCYGLALFITLWLLLTKRLGFAPYESSGWCAIIERSVYHEDYIAAVFGYDLWIVLTFILIIVIYISLHVFIKQEKAKIQAAVSNVDYKFMMIPLAFILLRIWSLILDCITVYTRHTSIPVVVHQILKYLAGIGDSGQGAVNFALFVIFTHSVRRRYLFFCCRCCFKRTTPESQSLMNKSSGDAGLGNSVNNSDPISISYRHNPEGGGKQSGPHPLSLASNSMVSTTATTPSLSNHYEPFPP